MTRAIPFEPAAAYDVTPAIGSLSDLVGVLTTRLINFGWHSDGANFIAPVDRYGRSFGFRLFSNSTTSFGFQAIQGGLSWEPTANDFNFSGVQGFEIFYGPTHFVLCDLATREGFLVLLCDPFPNEPSTNSIDQWVFAGGSRNGATLVNSGDPICNLRSYANRTVAGTSNTVIYLSVGSYINQVTQLGDIPLYAAYMGDRIGTASAPSDCVGRLYNCGVIPSMERATAPIGPLIASGVAAVWPLGIDELGTLRRPFFLTRTDSVNFVFRTGE